MYSSASRLEDMRIATTPAPSAAIAQYVAGATHRVQQRALESLVDGGAQPADVHVDHVGLRVEMQVPDGLEQHGAGHYLAGVAGQVFEQLEFLGGHVDGFACAGDLAPQQV